MQSLYHSEVLSYPTPAKGLAYLNRMINAVTVLNTYVPPVAITKRFYILYVVWDAFRVVLIYFFVETRGRSLEELDQLFEAKSLVKVSLEFREAVVLDKWGDQSQ
jgi:hypothetical protein